MTTGFPLPPVTPGLMATLAGAQDSGYQLPPAPLQAIVDAPRAPALSLGPKRNLAALLQTPALPSIREVAQPELKLAGMRINPRTYSASQFSFGIGLSLLDIETQKEIQVSGLPADLRIADLAWSPDQRYLAFSHVAYQMDHGNEANSAGAGVELWLLDIKARVARKLAAQPLSSVYGRGFSWLPDSQSLIVQLKPATLGAAPVASGIPTGPSTQDSQPGAGQKQLRTYPDLLKNEADAKMFEHYVTVQLAQLDLAGKLRLIGAPGQFSRVVVAPGGNYLLTQTIDRPYSYIVPASSFGKHVDVRDLDGHVVHTAMRRPLQEGLPPGNDAVSDGVREISWRVDAPATLVWAEAQDGGDPATAADIRDIVYNQAAPFTSAPQVLAQLSSRYAGIAWGRGDVALLVEHWYKTRAVKQWRIYPGHPVDQPAELIHAGSSEDRYSNPGAPVMRLDSAGLPRLLIGPGDTILLAGAGASDAGDRPFIDRLSLQTGQKERLFQSAAPYYESIAAVLSDDGSRLLTTREAPTERPNYYLRDLTQDSARQLTALTQFPHPLPQLKEVQKEQIRYQRADGVDLTATLLLPPGYDARRDGPLPMLMWAYPQEFKTASAASQTTGSPYRFNAVSYWGPAAFLAMGYAVLDNPSFPIVNGINGEEANDTYLPQLIADAEAAVDEVVRRGVADRHRIAIGGHSYGAFMTGNLLAHTRLFRAGIARSGAYNRTLTPFGFQSEDRPFWKAQEVYQAMSPFNYADRIKDALLMIHGEQDNNSGTFPIQSERMFQAIKGLGGTARLVILPNESHAYRARESIMQMLYETDSWLEKYVRNATP